jgi:hypothetical protein
MQFSWRHDTFHLKASPFLLAGAAIQLVLGLHSIGSCLPVALLTVCLSA